MSSLLAGQVAIVTGAGRGIGRALAIGFAAAGASVACVSRTQTEVEQTARVINEAGGRALAVVADVADAEAMQAMVARTLEAFGGLDTLVLNAGAEGGRANVAASAPDQWRATLETNLFGAYACARAAIPALKARGGGRIITLGSAMKDRGGAGRSDYACSKAALWALTRALALELRADNICVNELVPGPVLTAMTARWQEQQRAGGPAGHEWVKPPEAVLPLALFLATQPLNGPTGQSFSLRRDA